MSSLRSFVSRLGARVVRRAVPGALLLATLAPPAAAQVVFNQSVDTNWFTEGNWSNSALPTAASAVSLDADTAAEIAAPGARAASLVFGNGSSLTIRAGGDLVTTNVFTVATGANLTLAGGTLQVATGSSALTLATGSTLTFSDAASTLTLAFVTNSGRVVFDFDGSMVFNRAITGTGTVTKQGSGVVTLSTSSSYSGGTTVSGGTLRATHTNALGTGTVTLNGGDLDLAGSSNLNFGRAVVVTADSGIVSSRTTSGAAMTHTLGTLSMGNQTLTVSAGSNLTSGTAGISVGATTLTGDATLAVAANAQLTITSNVGETGGAQSLTKNGAGTLAVTGNLTHTGGTTVNAGTLTLTGTKSSTGTLTIASGATFDLVGSNSATLGGDVVNDGIFSVSRSVSTTYNGAISGSGSLLKRGANTLTLSGANTYSGGTVVSAGSLAITHAGNLGSGTLTLAGGTLNWSGTASDISDRLILGGGLAGFSLGSGNFTFASALAGTGVNFAKSGNGNLILSGANTYTGTTTLNGGTLTLAGDGTLGDSGNALVVGNGTLDLGGRSVTQGAVTYNSGGTIQNGTLTASSFLVNGANTLALTLAGDAALTRTVTGSVALTGLNTYTGQTRIENGMIIANTLANIGEASSLGAPTNASDATIKLGSGTNSSALQYTSSTNATTDRIVDLASTTGSATLSVVGAGSLTLTGNITASGAGTKTLQLSGSNTGPNTIAGTIANHNSTFLTNVAKIDSGVWVLAGNNTYSGITVVNSGTLRLAHTGALGGSAISVVGGILDLGGLEIASARNFTLSSGEVNNGTLSPTGTSLTGLGTVYAVIAGSGDLTKTGASQTATLAGLNTYTGRTSISAGTLSINSLANLGAASALGAPTTVANGTIALGSSTSSGTLTYTGAAASTDRAIALPGTTGGGTIESSGTGPLNFTGDFTATGAGSKTFVLAGTNTGNNTFAGAIVDQSGVNVTSFTKNNAGTWILTGANTYSGATQINAGTLRLAGDGALGGATNSLLVATGATLDLGGNTIAKTGLLAHGTIANGILTLANSGNVNLSGGSVTAVLAGNGGLSSNQGSLLGLNTYTGKTIVDGNTLTVNTLANLGEASSLGAPTTVANGTILLGNNVTAATLTHASSNHSTTNRSIELGGTASTASLVSTGTGSVTFTGTIANTGTRVRTLQLNGSSSAIGTISGAIADSSTGSNLSVSKLGTGTWVLSGANTYTGNTLVSGGTLRVIGDALGSTASLSLSGGTLELVRDNDLNFPRHTSTSGPATLLANRQSAGAANTYTMGTLALSGTDTFTLAAGNNITNGTTRFNFGTTSMDASKTISVGENVEVSFGAITGGSAALTKAGAGTLVLSATATRNGATNIQAGTLRAENSSAALGTGTLTLSGGRLEVAADSDFNFTRATAVSQSSTLVADRLTAGTALTHNFGTLALSGNSTFTIARGSNVSSGPAGIAFGATTLNAAAIISVDADASLALGAVSGTHALTKTGAGTLTLTSVTNPLSGATSVTGGTLRVDGSLSNSAMTVSATGTLSGTGTIGGLILANGATLAPGNSPGTLSAGNTTWNGGANYIWEINDASSPATTAGTNYDLLSISGTLTLAATSENKFTLSLVSLLANNTAGDVINFDAALDSSYTIASASGGIIGFDANAFTINSTGFTNATNGGTWNLSLASDSKNLNLNFAAASAAAIPEPATYAALVGALALGLTLYRKRPRR